jgi:hypothetical protein
MNWLATQILQMKSSACLKSGRNAAHGPADMPTKGDAEMCGRAIAWQNR